MISGLLRKDPVERLDAAGAQRMLRDVDAAPAVLVSTATRRPRQSHGLAAALAGSAALAVLAARFRHPQDPAFALNAKALLEKRLPG